MFAAQHSGDGFWLEIVVESEKAFVERLAARAESEDAGRWVVLGGEDQGR